MFIPINPNRINLINPIFIILNQIKIYEPNSFQSVAKNKIQTNKLKIKHMFSFMESV